jgi:hypothetical protein
LSALQFDRYIPRLLLDAPDFRRLWLGQTISVFGDQVTQLGLPLVAVLILGADATQMGTLTAFGLLPHLIFSLPAGVWLDSDATNPAMVARVCAGADGRVADPPSAAQGVLAMPRLPRRLCDRTLSSSVWNTLLVAVTSATLVEAMAFFTGARLGRRPDDRPLVQVLARRSRCSPIRSRSGRVFLRRSSARAADRTGGDDPRTVAAGLSSVVRIGSAPGPVGCDVNLFTRPARCSSCTRRPASVCRRAPSALPSGPGRSVA